jgi:hypothetical protein
MHRKNTEQDPEERGVDTTCGTASRYWLWTVKDRHDPQVVFRRKKRFYEI